MNNKQLILIIVAIIIAGCIVAGAVIYGFDHLQQTTENKTMNNTTNITKNITNVTENYKENSNTNNNGKSNGFYDDSGNWVEYNTDPNKGQIILPGTYEKGKELEAAGVFDCPHGYSRVADCPVCG
ncbi:MAG: hypothetical protein Q4P18_07270 [Methanobrevibacter sp.]|uniref:hypothetical protein n=1 Tax=Methanobrevibacter sp. TaxID=66852 RepID=UPI0026E03C16|nr:hypothetical protein [Methanobrevibacter sp.]MDO5849318.1 hypothetical protein [Methanobrevibacter sp.]